MIRDLKLAHRSIVLFAALSWPVRTTGMANRVVLLLLTLLVLAPIDAGASESLECLIEPHVLVDVTSSEIGVLAEVPVDKADAVRKGDVVASLHTDVENAALAVSRTRANSNSEIDLLRYDYQFNYRKRKRLKELQHKRMVSAQDFDEIQAAEEVARLRLQAAAEKRQRTELEVIRDELALARRIVTSPIDGVVVNRFKSAGEFVDGDPIVQLAQLNPLRIEMVVPISMYGEIKLGMEATVLPEMPVNGPFVASVTHIDPIMDAATATFGVRLSLPNPDHRLPAGLRCTLILLPYEEPSVESPEAVAATTPHSEPSVEPLKEVPTLGAATGCDPTGPATTQASCDASKQPVEKASGEKASGEKAMVREIDDGSASCSTLGPVVEKKKEDQLIKLLAANNIKFTARRESTVVEAGPWTVLSSRAHAEPKNLIDQAKLAGIRDIQWLKSGSRMHRFSFGRYRDQQNAKNRVEHLQKLGFEAVVEPSRKNRSALWLNISGDLDQAALSGITPLLSKSDNGLSLQPISCPQAASR